MHHHDGLETGATRPDTLQDPFRVPAWCATLRRMSQPAAAQSSPSSLKLLSFYLDTHSIEEALASAQGRRILWLEILVNDQLDLAPWMDRPDMQPVYEKACRWYNHYSRLVTFLFQRAPLPRRPGAIDFREYRTFAEALHFAYTHR